MKKMVSFLLAAAIMLSCAGGALADSPKIFRFATATEPTSLDPQLGNGSWITNVTGAIFEGLLRRYDGQIIPGVAQTYEVSEDGTVYTFHLRQSSWSDGTPVTAQTFVDSWNLLIKRQTPMTQFTDYFKVTDADGSQSANAVAVDDYTLVVTLNYNVPFMPFVFATSALAPVRVDLYEAKGDAYYQSVPEAMNGPFLLDSWNANDVMVLFPNKDYWNTSAVHFDEVNIYTVTDTITQANMYESGEVDMLTVDATLFSEYEDQGMIYYDDGSTYFIQFTTDGSTDETAKWLANRDFIEALSYCIDREDFATSLYGTAYTPSNTFIPTSATGYNGTTKGKSGVSVDTPFALKADYGKAEEKLNAAMAAMGCTLEEMPTFTLVVNDNAARQTAAQYVLDVCSMIGIKMKIDTIPSTTFWSTLRSGYRYDFAMAGSGPDVDDASTFFDVYTGKGKYADTFMRWHNDEYTALNKASWAATDEAERTALLVEMEELLLNHGPVIPLYFTRAAWMLKDGYTNINRNMTGADLDYIFGDVK